MIIAEAITATLLILGVIQVYKRSHAHPLHHFFWPVFLYKMVLTLFYGWLYLHYYNYGDITDFYNLSKEWLDLFSSDPNTFADLYFKDKTEISGYQYLIDNRPRVWFFIKCIFPVVLISGGNYWLTGSLLSFITFLTLWKLSKRIHTKFSVPVSAILFSFFLLPSFVFWSSGLSKESVSITLIALIIYNAISYFDSGLFKVISRTIVIILSLLLLWYIKFYYATALFTVVILLIIPDFCKKYLSGKSKSKKIFISIVAGISVLTVVLLVAFNNYYLSNFTLAIYTNYKSTILLTDGISNFELPGYDSSVKSFMFWIFPAAFYGLFGPYVWDIHNIFTAAAAIENLLLLLLVVSGIILLLRKKMKLGYQGSVIIFYSLALAGFLTLASPNWGTLFRYKVAILPFLYLLLLSRHPWSIKLDEFIKNKILR